MKGKITMKKFISALTMLTVLTVFAGCSNNENSTVSNESNSQSAAESDSDIQTDADSDSVSENSEAVDNNVSELPDLNVTFGYGGETYKLHLYDNSTASAIAKIVGTTDWNLPIYHYDDFENWEVMQYYDIPDRYDIPSNNETVTSQKAGEVYYSDPNRIILFYHDAEVNGEYTKLGYIDYSEEFVKSVEENPVLDDWGNKIVSITRN